MTSFNDVIEKFQNSTKLFLSQGWQTSNFFPHAKNNFNKKEIFETFDKGQRYPYGHMELFLHS